MVVGFHQGKRRARGKARRATPKPWRDEIFGALAVRERSNTLTDKIFWTLQLEPLRAWLHTLTDKVFGNCNLNRRVFG